MTTIKTTRRANWIAEKAPRATGWQVRNLTTGSAHWAANKTTALVTMNRLADADALRAQNARLAAARSSRATGEV